MRFENLAIGIATVGLIVALGTTSVSAAQTASVSTCLKMADQVKTALSSKPQAANHEAAAKQDVYGREFCLSGFYQKGIDHYTEALKLLGVNAT